MKKTKDLVDDDDDDDDAAASSLHSFATKFSSSKIKMNQFYTPVNNGDEFSKTSSMDSMRLLSSLLDDLDKERRTPRKAKAEAEYGC